MRRRDCNFPDNGFEGWGGYMQAKIAKLEEQFCLRAENNDELLSNIFNGVSIFVNGYTNPSADELKSLMAKHGGIYHTYQKSDDFIIASNLPDFKIKKISLAKVVRPEWITESIASNKLLDYKEFLLYNGQRTQPKLNFNKVTSNSDVTLETKSIVNLVNTIDAPETSTFQETELAALTNGKLNEMKGSDNVFENKHKLLCTEKLKHNDCTKTAADPNFISEFYNNSRLHHISQLGACFKQHINNLRENCEFKFPDRIKLKETSDMLEKNITTHSHFEGGKTIMHIDMDCFFVSVGLRNRPELRGLPIAVTHSKGGQTLSKRTGVDRNAEFNLYKQKQAKKLCKSAGLPEGKILTDEIETRIDNIAEEGDKFGSMSEIASCSYEARAKGVSNGMFMGAALRLCSDLKTIPYDFEGYKKVAFSLYNTVAKYTLDIEAVSCDEMYVDCTELLKSLDISAQDFATALRAEIKRKTDCPCSTGFGGNRLQARLATRHAKPDGQFFLFADLVNDFMFDIKLRDLPGVGRQTSQKLETLGHKTCGSLQSLSLNLLQSQLGNKTGLQLYDQCRGQDYTPLQFLTIRKSVSAEVNYGIRFENNDQCSEFLKQLACEVHNRMLQFKVVGKCITLKLMVRAEDAPVETAKFMGHGFCNVINKSVNLNTLTNDAEVISKEVIAICKKQKIDPKELRGIGIQITKLEMTTAKLIKGTLSKYLTSKDSKPQQMTSLSNFTDIADSLKDPEMKNVSFKSPNKFTSPQKKKSPLVGTSKSPVIKRRGRPPKHLSFRNQSTCKNLISKFFQEPNAESFSSVKEETYHDFFVKPKPVIVQEPETPIGLLGLPWQKIRELLRAWLDSGPPLPCDIELISAYMREMVINRNIDKLNILLNFLRRRTGEIGSEDWRKVFEYIIEQVQSAMIAVYGKELYIGD